MSTIFDRTSDIKEQWQKDLARVYKETYALLALRIAPLITFPPEAMKELSDPNCPEVFRVAAGLTQNSVQIASTGILHTYLKVTRPILFDPGKRDITDSTGYSFFLSATPSAAEIYDGLKMICPVAVPLLIEKIEGCPLSAKEQLKNAFQDEQRDVFIDCLNNLDCDISSLCFHSTVLAFERWLYLAMFTNPQAYLDFIYHRHLGSITEIIRATTPSEQELEEALVYINGSYNISFEAQSSSSDGYSPELMDEAMGNAEQMIAAIKNILKITTQVHKEFEGVLFPFEKQYYTNLIELPYVRQVVEEIEAEEEQAVLENPETQKKDRPWPTDVEFARAPCVVDNDEYFSPSSILGPATGLKMSTIQKLFSFLVENGKLANDNDVLMLFAYRLTGKNPCCIDTHKKIVWHGSSKKDCHLAYFLKKLFSAGANPIASKFWKKASLFFEYENGIPVDGNDERDKHHALFERTSRATNDTFAVAFRQELSELMPKESPSK